MNKKRKSKNVKEKKIFNYKIVGILGIIIVAIFAAMIINLLKKDYSEISHSYKESLALNGDLTVSLIYYTKGKFSNNSENRNYYYNQEEKKDVSEMTNDIIYNMAVYRLERLGELDDGVVEEELVKEQFSIIFGNNLKYKKISSFEYRCGKMIYEESYEKYKEPVYYLMEKNKSCDLNNNVVASTIGSFVYDDRIEIIQAVGFTSDDGTYYDYRLTNKVTDNILDEHSMRGNDHLFERYKYVFNYDIDKDVYYFKSIEKYKGDI